MMFGSQTKEFANTESGLLKNYVLEYVNTTLCGLNCGLTLDKKELTNTISTYSHLYLKHTNTNVVFGLACYANTDGFTLMNYYNAVSGETEGGGASACNERTNVSGYEIFPLTVSYNVFDSCNFVVTVSSRYTGMLPNSSGYCANLGVLETTNGLCLVSLLPTIQYSNNMLSNFASFNGILASVTPPGGKAFTAPAYYPAGGGTAISADTFTHCIQARISGITQGGLYKVGGKEYICIHAPSGLLMEVKR